MVSTNFADELKRAIHIAQAIAKEYQHQSFSPAHLLKGLLHNDVGLGSTLVTWGTDINYLRDWSEYRIEKYPKSARGNEEPRGDAKVEAVLEVADVIRMKIGETNLTPLAALIAISRPDVGFPKEQLKNFPLLESDLLANAIKESGGLISSPASPSSNATNSGASSEAGNTSAKALSKFCIDKTAAARSGKIDAIIGREKETRMMIEILGRRTKPNVVIVGEPGVGKTALVEGLAQLIVAGGVPAHLKNADLYQLDMGSLIAGASYKGEIEDRLKNIIAEIKQLTKGLLFIDEIHILLDPQGGANGLVNLLKPELARGELTVIGATTVDEYRKYMERDEAFSRRFEVLKVEEPDDTRARRMIEKVAPNFENHHNIKVSKETISEAVQLTRRYLKDRRLPDAAIDLIDRTMAAMKLMSETTQQEIDFLREELARLRSVYKDDEPVIFIEELRWFESQINDRISPVLLGQLEETQSTLDLLTPGAIADVLEALLNKLETLGLNKKEHIEKTDVAAVVAHKTGIPLGKIQANEQEKLLLLEEHLQKRVVGQDQAVEIISNAIRQNRSGVGETGKPTSFFLLGSTGTGKTELAKAVSELLFNDEKAMIRFDMSEFAEEHTVALLKGSPPGYVGYEEGGLLVTRIRQQPFAVVLFDEVEKAHRKVYDIFLQILDEGRLHDTLDREGDFSNAILLFTSNIGAEQIVKDFNKGNTPSQADLMKHMEDYFRPEFLGRLTGLIPFKPISEKTILQIFNIQLKPLLKNLEKQGITLTIDDDARHALAMEGYNPQFGARPIRGVIRNQLRQPLSTKIIAGEIGKGSKVHLKLGENGEYIWDKN